MRCFEIMIAECSVSTNGGPFVPEGRLSYVIPDEAQEHLVPILAPYNQNPMWYFEKLNYGRPPAPWALVCLDHEYAIGGHVATTRHPNAGVAFTTYNQTFKLIPDDFVPGVGVLVFANKSGLEQSADNSPLFAAAWNALRECSPERRWLVILDPLSDEWLAQVLPNDRERWLLSRSKRPVFTC